MAVIGSLTKTNANQSKSKDDKQFLLIAIALELDLQGKLDASTKVINALVTQYTRGGFINDSTSLINATNDELDGYFTTLVEQTATAVGDVSQAKVDIAMNTVYKSLITAGGYDAARAFKTELGTYADDQMKAFITKQSFGSTFATRIATIQDGSEKTVNNIIALGVKNGTSAKDIGVQLEQYINPTSGIQKTAPWTVYRDRFGKPADFVPDGVPAGTIQYNAMRIARSETADAYRDATTNIYASKPFTTGFNWVLSNSHEVDDECDDFADASPYATADDLPDAHPFCLCDIEPVLMSADDLADLFS